MELEVRKGFRVRGIAFFLNSIFRNLFIRDCQDILHRNRIKKKIFVIYRSFTVFLFSISVLSVFTTTITIRRKISYSRHSFLKLGTPMAEKEHAASLTENREIHCTYYKKGQWLGTSNTYFTEVTVRLCTPFDSLCVCIKREWGGAHLRRLTASCYTNGIAVRVLFRCLEVRVDVKEGQKKKKRDRELLSSKLRALYTRVYNSLT